MIGAKIWKLGQLPSPTEAVVDGPDEALEGRSSLKETDQRYKRAAHVACGSLWLAILLLELSCSPGNHFNGIIQVQRDNNNHDVQRPISL